MVGGGGGDSKLERDFHEGSRDRGALGVTRLGAGCGALPSLALPSLALPSLRRIPAPRPGPRSPAATHSCGGKGNLSAKEEEWEMGIIRASPPPAPRARETHLTFTGVSILSSSRSSSSRAPHRSSPLT
ncbi:unnamed protein product [Lampetra fluviatilis]